MSMVERIRQRRDAARRSRALERALRGTTSHAVRQEIIAIAQRDM
ncbi:MAG TPA: hypothetical protein VFC00_09845 [Micromonosporaceae bacterium]|nr:hypothetical protein [Micromonosporaceae bacterium]